MEYITRPKYYFPGSLSDEAAELLKKIYAEGVYFPDWLTMSKAEIATFDELMPGNYVESCAFRGYRVKGTSYVDTVLKQRVQDRNAQLYVLYAGTDPLITKWEARAQIINFRLRPWMERVRVREAHLQLESDIELSKLELKRGA